MKSKQELLNSFYKTKDGYYHTKIFNELDFNNQDDLDIYYEALLDLLDDQEVMFVKDDSDSNMEYGLVLYRSGLWIFHERLLYKNRKYHFNAEKVFYTFPSDQIFTLDETVNFIKKLTSYCDFEKIALQINNYKYKNQVLLESMKYTSNKDKTKIKVLSFLIRKIYFQTIIVITFILVLLKEYKTSLFFLGTGTLIYSLYMMLGIRLNFKHVYHTISKAVAKEPDLDNIYWEGLKKGSVFFFPRVLMLISFILIGLGFVIN